MVRSASVAAGAACARGTGRASAAAMLALLAVGAVPGHAGADTLAQDILAAAAQLPPESGGRQCAFIPGLADSVPLPVAFGGRLPVAVVPTDGYAARTQGAYLGSTGDGYPTPPFVQALLDAGAAVRVKLSWVRLAQLAPAATASIPGSVAPALGSPRPSPASPASPGSRVLARGEVYLVSGPDRAFFDRAGQNEFAPSPPKLDELVPAGTALDAGTPPAGVWSSSRICVTFTPERVLERTDPVDHGNGIVEVDAAVLFKAQSLPSWISDPRVIEAARPNLEPRRVVPMRFRSAGDGWRYVAPSAFLGGNVRTRILDGE